MFYCMSYILKDNLFCLSIPCKKMFDLELITMKSDNIKDLSSTQAVQGALLVAGTVGIKILIAKALRVADDVSNLNMF